MALYILTYDLRKARDYQTLWAELEKFNAVRILESDWCFRRFNTTAVGLRDYFKNFVDSDDGLFVAEMSETEWASWKVRGTPKDLA